MDKHLISQVVKYETYFQDSQYAPFVKRARCLLDEGREAAAKDVLSQLPTEKELLEDIVNKLKDKPVHKTLKRGLKENANDVKFLKGLFSLGTHIVIECEKGNSEYKMLLPTLYSRIGALLKEI